MAGDGQRVGIGWQVGGLGAGEDTSQ